MTHAANKAVLITGAGGDLIAAVAADLNANDSSGRTPIQLFREKHAKKFSLIRDPEEAFPDDHSQ